MHVSTYVYVVHVIKHCTLTWRSLLPLICYSFKANEETFLSRTLCTKLDVTEYVTRHEKIGLMCIKYTTSNHSTYLIFCVRYTSFVNCIKYAIVCYSNCESFIDKLCLGTML